jgi:hypothetical protein
MTTPDPHLHACVSCGEPLRGSYCHVCGERRADDRDLTLSAFARYAAEAVTNTDAKLYTTFRRLVGSPGFLTREFMAGRRKPWVGPLQLFLLVNLVYFLLLQVGWGTNAFTTDLVFHRTQPIYGPVADRMIQDRVGEWPERQPEQTGWDWVRTWTPEQLEFRDRFIEASPRYANSLVLLMVPLFALGTRLLRRRGLMVRELVFSLHFMAVMMLLILVLPIPFLPLLLFVPAAAAVWDSELLFMIPFVLVLFLYLYPAFRTAHGDGRLGAALRALLAFPLLLLVLTLYRMVLFFVVFLAV